MNGYFDHNATTPMSERAREVWLKLSEEHWHNPSSLYREAGLAKMRLEEYREELADHLGIDAPERVVFTSGATEANNAVIRHLAETFDQGIALSAIEHPCVQAPISRWFSAEKIFEIPVDPATGIVSLERLQKILASENIVAVSVMAANNETGAIQPWPEISAICRSSDVLFHTDAAQWFGKLDSLGFGDCDFVTGSGHKFGGGRAPGFSFFPKTQNLLARSVGRRKMGNVAERKTSQRLERWSRRFWSNAM